MNELPDLIEELRMLLGRNVTSAGHIRDRAIAELTRLRKLEAECKAAGFVKPEGEVRKVLGRLWTTEDGCILGVDYEGFLFREESCGDIQRCWPSVCINNIDQDYKWYSTPEAARKAGERAQ